MPQIQLIKPDLPQLEEVAFEFREVLANGRVTNFGKYVTLFEEEASRYLGAQVVTLASGTAGLLLGLQALGLRPGQKVILPSFTFMATAQAILYAGGVPVFAEIEDDLTLSPADLERLLLEHENIGLVMPVHTYGLPCQTTAIEAIVAEAEKRSVRPIPILYDAAHAFGSAVNEQRVGCFGSAEVFSLSVTKTMVSVEGGILASQDAGLVNRIRKMRNYGIEENYNAWWPGLNSKMSEFHAIIGLHNLRRLDSLLAERTLKANYYQAQLQAHTQFQPIPGRRGIQHTYKDFTVLIPLRLMNQRAAISAALAEAGVETRAYFSPPVHQQRLFRNFADRSLPKTELLAQRVLTLPFYSTITEPEMDQVVRSLAQVEAHLA